MNTELDLFTAALNLANPWRVVRTDFELSNRRLDLYLDFERGTRFGCPVCSERCPVHDTVEKKWRHLNFFQYEAYLHARLPRISCEKDGILQVDPPCARPGSGFTLLFEAFVLTLAKDMPVKAIADLVGEHDTRIWRIIQHHVDAARKKLDMSTVTKVGFDETSSRRGHDYISIFVDMDEKRVLFATPGKDSDVVKEFAQDLRDHGGDPEKIEEASIDMSAAFIKGTEDHLPHASITFDKFHVTKLISDAIQETRRKEQKESPAHYELLKNSRFSLLKNEDNRNFDDVAKITKIRLSKLHLKTAKAWRMKEAFRDAYNLSGDLGERALGAWCRWAKRSKVDAMVGAAETILKNWNGVIKYFHSHLTNAILESINGRIQAARAKARGYRNKGYMTCILYLIAGKLDLPLTHA